MKKLLLFIAFVQQSVLSYGHPTQTFWKLKFVGALSVGNGREVSILYGGPTVRNISEKAAPEITAKDFNPNRKSWETFFSNNQVKTNFAYSEISPTTSAVKIKFSCTPILPLIFKYPVLGIANTFRDT